MSSWPARKSSPKSCATRLRRNSASGPWKVTGQLSWRRSSPSTCLPAARWATARSTPGKAPSVVQCRASLSQRDVALAESLAPQDRDINRLNREIFRLAVDAGDEYDVREWSMHMTLVARAYERIGDNAVDIGEQVAFVVTGLFREFSSSQ